MRILLLPIPLLRQTSSHLRAPSDTIPTRGRPGGHPSAMVPCWSAIAASRIHLGPAGSAISMTDDRVAPFQGALSNDEGRLRAWSRA